MRARAARWTARAIALVVVTVLVAAAPAQAGVYLGPGGERAVVGAIEAKWLALGGPTGFLSRPLTDELGTPVRQGRFTHFERGSVYWSPATGAHEVHGAVLARWAALGWENGLGFPLTDELGTPDGLGRFNHFEGGSIYWSAATGAQEVHGAIGQVWAAQGWETGELGFPTTDELGTPDGLGRFNHFQGGSVYWTARTGARTLVGPIREAWARLGWETSVLGYPVSDTSPLHVGAGLTGPDRYAVFDRGRIYWSAATGAHEVHGAILDRWVQMGADRSGLGLPVTDEHDVPGGRRSDFEGGSLVWTPAGGVVLEASFAGPSYDYFQFDKGPAPMVMDVEFSGATNNVALDVGVASSAWTSVISRIGDWSGTVPLDFGLVNRDLHTRWFLFSTMRGWTLRVRDLSTVPVTQGGRTISSSGADVLRLGGPAGTATFSGVGCEHDARVRWYDGGTAPGAALRGDGVQLDLAGTVTTGPGGYLEIRCDGPWTLTLP